MKTNEEAVTLWVIPSAICIPGPKGDLPICNPNVLFNLIQRTIELERLAEMLFLPFQISKTPWEMAMSTRSPMFHRELRMPWWISLLSSSKGSVPGAIG